MAFLRIWVLAALCAGIWLLAAHGQYRPPPAPADAPLGSFSAVRASAVLGQVLGPEKPHPVGSAQNAALRGRLLDVLADMGVKARTETAMSCYGEARWRSVSCGTVNNIVAPVTPGKGDPVLLMAHLDSVAAGPGACDDGCGMASLLETIRALKASHFKGRHPVMALFTDGEEPGMLGAAAFLRRGDVHPMAVINSEARGDRGPSYLFQTSAQDSALIDLYAKAVNHYATSSLYDEIYKYLPNDTDLTLFLRAGVPGYNFSMIGNIAAYHTPLDVRANIDLSGLQQQGAAALGLARILANKDPAALEGHNAVYLDVLGRWLPRLPESWALPLAIVTLVLVLLAGGFRRRNFRVVERPILAFIMPPLLVAGAVGVGFALHGLAVWVAGVGDPSFAHPVWLRLALALGVWAVALVTARWAGAVSAWLWVAGLAVVSAITAPGLLPYFLFPALVGAPLLLISVRGGRGIALFIAALAGLLIWLQLNVGTEPLMGLKTHYIFTATAAFALVGVLPLLAPARGGAWVLSIVLSAVGAVALTITAGLMPAYSTTAPQRMNITYLQDAHQKKGRQGAWLVSAPQPPDAAMRRAAGADFSSAPVRITSLGLSGYLAVAPQLELAGPEVSLPAYRPGHVTMQLHGTPDADTMMLYVPARAGLSAVGVNGLHFPVWGGSTMILCQTPDCARARITLDGRFRMVWLRPAEIRYGLPPQGMMLEMARPSDAVPSGRGDVTIVAGREGLLQPGP